MTEKWWYCPVPECMYDLDYSITWDTVEPFVLTEEHRQFLKRIFAEICEEYGYRLISCGLFDHRISLSVGCRPTVAPCDVVRTLRSLSLVRMIESFPEARRFYSVHGSLWKGMYFVSS